MPGPTLYRADLLRVLAAGEGTIPPAVAARLCGFDYEEPVSEAAPLSAAFITSADLPAAPPPASEPPPAPAEKPKFRFWRVESLEVEPEESHRRRHEPPPEIAQARPLTDADFRYSGSPLPGRPLLPWFRLWPFVRMALSRRAVTRRPDVPRVVRLLAEGRSLRRLPCVTRSGWHPRAHVLLDRREGLAPFWDDYDFLIRRLKDVRGKLGLRIETVPAPALHASPPDDCCPVGLEPPPDSWRALVRAAESAAVLVLGDLNQFQGALLQAPWLGLGRQFRRRGVRPWVLCPCPRDRWSPALAHVWQIAAWDRGLRLPTAGRGQRAEPPSAADLPAIQRQRRAQAEQLAVRLAPAIRVERGFLRDVRLLLPHAEADVGTEYDLWQDTPGSTPGFTFPTEKLRDLRAAFARLPAAEQDAVLRLLRRHHEYCANVFGHLEVLALRDVLAADRLTELTRDGVLPPDALIRADDFLRRYVAALHRTPDQLTSGTDAFAARDLDRLQAHARHGAALQALWALSCPEDGRPLPDWVRPDQLAWLDPLNQPETRHEIRWRDGLHPTDGHLLWALQSRSAKLTATVETAAGTNTHRLRWEQLPQVDSATLAQARCVTLRSDRETIRLAPATRPAWARRMWLDGNTLLVEAELEPAAVHQFAWQLPYVQARPQQRTGEWVPLTQPPWATRLWADEFGLAAEFAVGGVPFVLRWIPPGRFLMGSPADEPGRWDKEGPQHEVTLTRGFWLGETPVTQAQWRAVVEAAQITRKPRKDGGRNSFPALPDVAWEARYLKCGPTPSHFRGPGELPVEQVDWDDCRTFCQHFNALLPDGPGFRLPTEAQWEYACRAGTTGAFHDGSPCTQPEGKDPALDRLGWFDKNSDGETHPVKQKLANAWGLYDLHGNVWEWCADAWGDYTAKPQTDPFRDGTDEAHRVVRGGSWFFQARFCRAAFRGHGHPGNRNHDRGFRLAAGLELQAAEPQGAERPPDRRGGAGAEGRSPEARPTAERWWNKFF